MGYKQESPLDGIKGKENIKSEKPVFVKQSGRLLVLAEAFQHLKNDYYIENFGFNFLVEEFRRASKVNDDDVQWETDSGEGEEDTAQL